MLTPRQQCSLRTALAYHEWRKISVLKYLSCLSILLNWLYKPTLQNSISIFFTVIWYVVLFRWNRTVRPIAPRALTRADMHSYQNYLLTHRWYTSLGEERRYSNITMNRMFTSRVAWWVSLLIVA